MKRIILLVLITALCVISPASQTQDAQPSTHNPYQAEYEQMLYPVVRITAGFSTGSGVIINHKAHEGHKDNTKNTAVTATANAIYILTAYHVVENENTANIELYNSTVITASVVITDTVKDLALLKPTGLIISYSAHLAPRKYTPYLFTPVWAIGCSLGLPPRPSNGTLTAINPDSWEVSSPILPGNSGGPIYDAHTYEVIGIAVWVKVYGNQLVTTMAGVVHIQDIYTFLEQVKN